MQQKPYIHLFQTRPGKNQPAYHGVFALRLLSCPAERAPGVEIHQVMEKRVLEQVDFINALFSPHPARVFALRYLTEPNPYAYSAGKNNLIFLSKISGKTKSQARDLASELFDELMNLLGGLLPRYTWQPITDSQQFQTIWQFSGWDRIHLVEICRREDQVRLETMRPRPVLGRGRAASIPAWNAEEAVYIIHKFMPRPTTLSRLLRAMLLHSAPIVWQVSLSPVWLTEEEEAALMNEIGKCEKREQESSAGTRLPIGQAETIHQLRAKTVAEALLNQLMRLQDAPFLLKIYLASPEPLPKSLIEATGIEITAPVGLSANSMIPIESSYLQMGGFDVISPENPPACQAALQNLKNLQFQQWTETLAPSNLQRVRFLVDALEAAGAFRFPLATPDGLPGMQVNMAQIRPVPNQVAELAEAIPDKERLLLAENHYLGFNQKIYMKETDRRQHMYIVGQTGTGKTTLMKSMILSDMAAGKGLAVIDPHGDLFDELLSSVPQSRWQDVVILDATDTDYPVGLNLLECQREEERYFIVREFKAIMEKLLIDQYGLQSAHEFAGPVFYRHTQMNMLLAMSNPHNPGTLLEFYEIFQHKNYWKRWLPLQWKDRLLERWVENSLKKIVYTEIPRIGENSMGDWISSKYEDFVFDPKLRLIFGQKISTINLREIMDKGKILLVNLAKGELAEPNARFLGMVLMAKIQAAAMQRAEMPVHKRKTFYLYVDEFQSLATENFVLLLSEARKFGIGLILANQFLLQIDNPRIVQSIFGNVGTLISFRVGYEDAEKLLAPQFLPYYDPFDLTHFPNWHACIRTTVNGQVATPFSLHTVLPPVQPDEKTATKVREYSRQQYSRPREEVEQEIERSWKAEKE